MAVMKRPGPGRSYIRQTKKARTMRRTRISRVPTAMRDNMMFVTRTIKQDAFGMTPNAWTSLPMTFKASDLPNYSDYQALFDYYRINAVKVTFIPYWNSSDLANQSSASNTAAPRVYTFIDKNGITAGTIATEDLFLSNANAKLVKNPLASFDIYIKNPGVEVAVEGVVGGGAAASTSLHASNQWLDTNVGNTPHFGAAIGGFVPSSGVPTMYYHVVYTYYMQFKSIQ